MREVTYSQDMVIKDKELLGSLCVFCGKIYLPCPSIASDLYQAACRAGHPLKDGMARLLSHDPEKNVSDDWREAHALLFENGTIGFLPPHEFGKHERRYLDERDQIAGRVYEDLYERGITTTLALGHHIIRDDVPGIEFFEGADHTDVSQLAESIFFVEIPRVSADDTQVCELRELAHRKDLGRFWDMIDEQVASPDDDQRDYLARAQQIRDDFRRWTKDDWAFGGNSPAVSGTITLCFVNSCLTPLATLGGASWIGEVNRRWAQRKDSRDQTFKFISRVNGRIRGIEEHA